MVDPYNPLHKINLGKSVAEALLDRPAQQLKGLTPFEGAGIYALYYNGSCEPYSKMASRNAQASEWPVYIGKAIPAGGRRGASMFAEITGRVLQNRLREHAESVEAAANLDVNNFKCRHLVTDDIWIPLGETLLIAKFRPVWNLALEGFGNHDPGAGRYGGLRPLWDVLHPGRPWALRCRERDETQDGLAAKVQEFLEANEPPPDPHIKFAE